LLLPAPRPSLFPYTTLFRSLALSLGLLWGFVGMVSFGQAAFFALGAYTMGLAMQQMDAPVNPAYLGLLASVLLGGALAGVVGYLDRKSTRLNSSHVKISYAV